MRRYLVILLFLAMQHAYAGENFGRLFTTPVERANLDHLRQTSKPAALKEDTATDDQSVTPTPAGPISVQGYVKRSDGQKSTVWINNQPIRENSANGEVEVGTLGKDGSQVQITVPASGDRIKMKAGQVYLPESGQVQDTVNTSLSKETKSEKLPAAQTEGQ